MDLTKKRKADENGGAYPVFTDFNSTVGAVPSGILSPEDAERILKPLTKEQLLPILRSAVLHHPDVLEAVRVVADADPVQRKLFVRGLGWETTTEKLRQVFSVYGVIDEGNTIVITDKNSGKSKGYGFVTFKHIDAAILALKEPNKKIDGRITVTQLAASGNSGNSHYADVSLRKVYVGNVPFEISSERLLSHFSVYGEIEEGPLGFDKQTGTARGFAFFVYKTEEGAKASLVDPMKTIDGHQVLCKLATDNKKQKPNMGASGGMVSNLGHSQGMPKPSYNMGGYMPQPPQQHTGNMHQNASFNPAMGGPGGLVNGAPLYTAARNFGVGLVNGGGYRMPPSSMGMQSNTAYPDSGNYGLQTAYPSQPNRSGTGPGSRLPGYQGMPQYY